jgi:flagellar hook-associated protein 3 FlgL
MMRVSTAQMFDTGTAGILNNQSTLFKIQNQLSTGRRVLTPADDPVASAQVLIATQSKIRAMPRASWLSSRATWTASPS